MTHANDVELSPARAALHAARCAKAAAIARSNAGDYRLYVVRFSDDRIKVGISSDVVRRMTYYKQEARRNDVQGIGWWACAPFSCKAEALRAERIVCNACAALVIPRHREWFRGDVTYYAALIDAIEQLRSAMGKETGLAAKDLPYLGMHGYAFNLGLGA